MVATSPVPSNGRPYALGQVDGLPDLDGAQNWMAVAIATS